ALGLVVRQHAAAARQRAAVELPVAGRIVVPQGIEDAAPGPEAGVDRSTFDGRGRVALAANRLVTVQDAAADGGRTAQVIHDPRANPGTDQTGHTGGTGLRSPPWEVLWENVVPLTVRLSAPTKLSAPPKPEKMPAPKPEPAWTTAPVPELPLP